VTNLEFYLTQDHRARNLTTLMSVTVGTVLGIITQVWGAKISTAAAISFIGIAFIEVTRALAYKLKPVQRKEMVIGFSSSRRSLLRLAYASVAFMFFAALRLPRLQASIIEKQLDRATKGTPPYKEADRIIQFAAQNKIPVKAKSIEAAKRRVIEKYDSVPAPVQNSVKFTLAQLISLEAISATGEAFHASLAVFLKTGQYKILAPIVINEPQSVAIAGEGPEQTVLEIDFNLNFLANAVYQARQAAGDLIIAHLSAIRQVTGVPPAFLVAEAQLVKLRLVHIAVLDVAMSGLTQKLDGIFWVDVTFDHCEINYDGGSLFLQSVRFIQCTFAGANVQAQMLLMMLENSPSPVTYKSLIPID